MFYAMMLPILLLMVSTILRLRASAKHDRVLYRFCQIRRDLMAMLRKDGFDLSRADYIVARNLLEILNHTIHNYRSATRRVFRNGRESVKLTIEYSECAEELEKLPRTGRQELIELHRRFAFAMLEGFLSFTPFFRFEIVARVALFLLGLLPRLGFKFMQDQVSSMKKAFVLVRSQRQALLASGINTGDWKTA